MMRPSRFHDAAKRRRTAGLTLFELLVVLGVLAVLGTLAIPVVGGRLDQSRNDVTRQSLQRVREVLVGTYHADMGDRAAPGNFLARYGETGDPAVLDGWGNPIVLQVPQTPGTTEHDRTRHARLVSAGPNGVIDTDPGELMPNERGDDLVLFLWIADP
jgi:type II secretory pathway pseudopilin PulG